MAVDGSSFFPVVDAPFQGMLQQSPDGHPYRKWLTLLPVFFISAVVVALVLWGVFIAADFALNSAASVHANH
jgi:hypothetical protein